MWMIEILTATRGNVVRNAFRDKRIENIVSSWACLNGTLFSILKNYNHQKIKKNILELMCYLWVCYPTDTGVVIRCALTIDAVEPVGCRTSETFLF
jgi:hypothetical protein